eukprot:Gb_09146 [translate_table: standard]
MMRLFLRQIYNVISTPTNIPTIIPHKGKPVPRILAQYTNQKGFVAVPLDLATNVSLLHACTNLKELKQSHAHMLKNGLEQNIFLGTKLVNMYNMFDSLVDAQLVFDKLLIRNVFIWNALIRGYVRNELPVEALAFYCQMLREGIQPDNFTFPCVLKACADILSLQRGKGIHDHVIKSGFDSDVFVASTLIAMYDKCGSIVDARNVFDKMAQRDAVVWNALIAAYSQNGFCDEALTLFCEMELASEKPDSVTIASILPACAHLAALQEGQKIHQFAIRSGFESDVFVGSALIDMYAKCGSIHVACHVFDKMSQRNTISWNTMIAGYAQNGHCNEALNLFHDMQLAGMKPDLVTISCALPACASLEDLQSGKEIHNYIIRSGFETDVCVGNTLIDMYAKCKNIEDAQIVFNRMPLQDVVSWCTIIAGNVQNGNFDEALKLFSQMQLMGIKSDSDTVASVLPACARIRALKQGKEIHGYVIRSGFETDDFVASSLIDMYAKCGIIDNARHLFDTMSQKNVVSWNAMIAGYAQNGLWVDTLRLFYQIQLAGMKPDSVTMASIISACAGLTALRQSKEIHGYIIKSGFACHDIVGNGLVDMYAKCGTIETANQVFGHMSQKDVVSWNSMIAGYGMHGRGKDALALFYQMQQAGMKPNHITFVAVLSACSHAGLVDEGCQQFNSMIQDHHIIPSAEHYACMVDILGRAGHLDEAHNFIKKMPIEPDAGVWGTLFAACRIHRNIELGEYVAERLFDLKPENAGYYVLLSNLYAADGRWNDVAKVRRMLKDRGLKKMPGCSWIEVKNQVHAFIGGDKSHPQSEKIYAMLESLVGQMKEAGYVPDKTFALHDVEDQEKECILSSHSEKLAIAFGIMSTCPTTPIFITKNLRVCGDCHNATKFISKIVLREIIIRDASRFHHVKGGLCSCGDYW